VIVQRAPRFFVWIAVVILASACQGSEERAGLPEPPGSPVATSSGSIEGSVEPDGTVPVAEGAVLSHDGVSIQLPDEWDGRVLFLDPQGESALLQAANFDLPDRAGLEPPGELAPGEKDPIKAMAGDNVLITLLPGTGVPLDPPVEIRPPDFLPAGHPRIPRGHALAQRAFCLAQRCFSVEVDFARSPADPDLLRQVNTLLATLEVEAEPPHPSPAPAEWSLHASVELGYSVRYPAVWRRVAEPLMPLLSDPTEILALATFDAAHGGDNCAHMPENALEAMGPQDALLVLEERHGGPETGGGTLADYPERPAHFGPNDGYPSEASECLDRPKQFFDRLIPFRDQQRRFYAYVAFGKQASDKTRQEAWMILDSLLLQP
jgi:hypothetical protein